MAAPTNRVSSRSNFRNASLLIIEDNPDHSFIIKKAVRQSLPEINLTVTSNESQTITYLTNCLREEWTSPRLILLDLYLPNRQNGWCLLEQIKLMPHSISKIPTVLFSNSTSPADIAEAYQRGCSSYEVKPTAFTDWLSYFTMLRTYWWETVTLPKPTISLF